MSSTEAIYIVNIDGEQYRRPVKNPYTQMHKIKKYIKTEFNLDYDFDLEYKGAKILETSSLNENKFDDFTPLVVIRKTKNHVSNETSEQERKRPKNPLRQLPRVTTIHKVVSLESLSEEEIDDETELKNNNPTLSNEEYHWKPTFIIRQPARSIDEEEMKLTLHISTNNPLSSRSRSPCFHESIEETIDGNLLPVDSLRRDQRRNRPQTTKQTTVTLSLETNSPITSRKVSARNAKLEKIDSIEIEENLPSTRINRLPNGSSNETSGYDSSSSSRSSSPTPSNFNLIIPTANRNVSKGKRTSSLMTINVQSLNDFYSLELPTDATLQELYHIMKQQKIQLENYSNRTHILLLFNRRMHIFRHADIEDERINTFLSLNSLSKVNGNNSNDNNPHFFVYALNRKLYEQMYVYEKDPLKFFDNSIWWQSYSIDEQTPLAQSILLSTLYVLYQYFRRPPLNEKASRRALEIQFLLYSRKYLFPPAFHALKHLLIRKMFAFEKTVLIDGLLKLLSEFCPLSIDRNLLGIYTPHLFCWLFQQSRDEMETQDGFLEFDLMRYSTNTNQQYINDPVTIHDLNPNILYEYHEADRFQNITRNIDLFSLIKYLKNTTNETSLLDTYTIDMSNTHLSESIVRFNEEQIKKLERTMSRVYRSFTLLVRNAIENSNVRDQLILVNNKQVGICFKRRQRIKPGENLDQDLTCFMPADPSHKGIVTFNTSDIFEVVHGRPDPHIPNSLQSNLPMKSEPIISSSPAEQITLILLDISDSMFTKRKESNPKSKRFIDISMDMLIMMSKNLHRQSRPHAIGIILFGKNVIIHCPITTNADEFEKAIYKIPKHGQPWTSMYDAISTGLDHIRQYESKESVVYNCDKLMICITDGINNRGKLTINNLKQMIRRNTVVIDLIFFSSNINTSHAIKDRQSILALRQLCAGTGGIIYRTSSIEPIDLATTFEQEAILWLKARKERKTFGYGIGTLVDYPMAREPEKLYQTAVRVRIQRRLTNDTYQQTDLFRRLHAEANDVARQQIENIQLYICIGNDNQMNYTFWKLILQGPRDSPYRKGHWLLYVIFSDDYPIIPPIIRFHTPIYHLNISADGHICHDLFDIGWSTAINMVEILHTLNKLLMEPDIHNAISEENLQFYEQDRNAYELRVCKHCAQHASKTSDQLKCIYRLEET